MADHCVDTNVLLVASAADEKSKFKDTHVSVRDMNKVFDWVRTFRADDGRRLVMDDRLSIFHEYRNKLTEQDYGFQVAIEKISSCRYVFLEWDGEYAVVPEAFKKFDKSDRKFLAAALTDTENISIVNATDSDWLEIEDDLVAAGVRVEHLLGKKLKASKK